MKKVISLVLVAIMIMASFTGCVEKLISSYKNYSWQERVENATWETTFMIAANVTDKVLNVHYSEHYGIEFTVFLSKKHQKDMN